MKILLGDFNAKAGRDNIFKPKIGNQRLHQDNDNGVRIINFNTKHFVVRSNTMFWNRNILKYTRTYSDEKTQNQTEQILIDRR